MNFLDSVWSFIQDLWALLTGFFQGSILSIRYIIASVGITTDFAAYAPDFIGSCIIAVVSVSVIKSILGRHTG